MASYSQVYARNLARRGYGLESKAVRNHYARLFARYPAVLQNQPPPRLGKLAELVKVTYEPEAVGPVAANVFSALHSAHRRIALEAQRQLGPVSAEVLGCLMALPAECAGAKPYAEAATDRDALLARLRLIEGTIGRTPRAFQEGLARKGIVSAARATIEMSLRRVLLDYRIAAAAPQPTHEVKPLLTIRHHQEHGLLQSNCVGDLAVLAEVARGAKLYFEVALEGRIYSASMSCDGRWKVDRVERSANRQVGEARWRQVADLVEAAVAPLAT